MELNYEDDLKIDPDNLDLDWLHQPSLFMEYSHLLAEAEDDVRRSHEKIKIVRSELVLEVSGDPSLAGADKATGPVIEAYYRTHKKYKKAKEDMLDAEHESDILRTAVFAFNQRKAALENLVKLNGQNYFASPSVPQELGVKMKESSKKAGKRESRGKVRKRLRKEDK